MCEERDRRCRPWPYRAAGLRRHAEQLAGDHEQEQQEIVDLAAQIEASAWTNPHRVIELARTIRLTAALSKAALADIRATMIRAARLGNPE